MREITVNRTRVWAGLVALAAVVLVLPACAKKEQNPAGGQPAASRTDGQVAAATEFNNAVICDGGPDFDADASSAPYAARTKNRAPAKRETLPLSGLAEGASNEALPTSERAATTPDFSAPRGEDSSTAIPYRYSESTEETPHSREKRSVAEDAEVVRPHQPRIRAGTLTAGSFDDHQNIEDFRQFVSESLQGDGHEVLPRLAIGQRVLIHVRNGQDQPVADARVQVRPLPGNQRRHATNLADLHTGSDGRTLLLTGRDGGTTERYLVTVTPPHGGAAVEQEFSARQAPWLVVLPEAAADLPTRLDLALVVDTTGSMSDELEYLKAEIDDIAAAVQRMFPNVDARLALVVYRDEGDDYVTRSHDFTGSVSDFRRTLSQQRASGGGDYPEAMHAALEHASRLSWRDRDTARMLFLVGDAPPHDRFGERTFTAMDGLRRQGVHIYPVAGSGVKVKAEFILRSAAFLTLGQYLFLTDHSGVGLPHASPHVPEYAVEHLNQLMLRMIASELAGRHLVPQQVIAIEQGDLDPMDIEPEPVAQQTAGWVPIRRDEPDRALAWLPAGWFQWPPAWLILLVSVVVLGAGEALLRRTRVRSADGAGR